MCKHWGEKEGGREGRRGEMGERAGGKEKEIERGGIFPDLTTENIPPKHEIFFNQ